MELLDGTQQRGFEEDDRGSTLTLSLREEGKELDGQKKNWEAHDYKYIITSSTSLAIKKSSNYNVGT